MSITALSAASPPAAAASSPPAAAENEQRFLKLLVTQLNNQDPLNPLDNAQLTSQLAQMSTVSGIEKMNATLQSLVTQGGAGQLLQAASLVGRAVLAPGNAFAGGGGASAFALELPASASSVKAVVTDGAGSTVRTFDFGSLPAGLHSQGWDGKNDAGEAMPAGVYKVQVFAANGSTPVPASTLVYDQVASVSQEPTGLSLALLAGGRIALSDVRSVL